MSSGSESDKDELAAGRPKAETSPPSGEGETPSNRNSSEAQLATSKPRLRPWVHYAVYIGLALILVLRDPFEWGEITSNASQDLAYRFLIGPHYPTEQRDKISVVLFNETTLKYLGATWPTALGVHAEILETIRAMKPRAVMVDFIFPDHRRDPTVTELQETIRAYKDLDDIQLFFARAEGANLDWIRPDLSEARLTSVIKPDGDGVSRSYQLCSLLAADSPVCACVSGVNRFEACSAEIGADSSDSPVALTAAFDMFERKDLPDWFDVQRAVPMEVVWSNRLNPINGLWMRKQTATGLEKLCVEVNRGIVDWIWRVLSASEGVSFRQTCPYATTVTAHGLLQASEDPRLREIIHDSYVFYGGDLAGLEDTVVPPTHIKLPGVYLHAMALDNLLTFEGRYKRSAVWIFDTDIAARDVSLTVAVALAIIVVAFARSEPVIRADRIAAGTSRGIAYFRILWRRWRYWFLFNLFMFAVIVAICWALYSWAELSPKNWLGHWGLLTALSGMAKGRLAEGVATTLTERFVPPLGPIIFMERQT